MSTTNSLDRPVGMSVTHSMPSVGSTSSFPHVADDPGTPASQSQSHHNTSSRGSTGRLLIVANRLPVSMSMTRKSNGPSDISFSASSGGLVSALAGTDLQSFWIGWPGGEVKSAEDRKTVITKLKPLNSIPVFLAADVCDLFYNGFCNDLLWPLFHYIPLPIEAIKAHDKQFKAYQRANAEFAKVVLDNYQEGDAVWVHDYHLMLLPALLRRAKPTMRIGFFFHTPFPSSEIYRMIPSRADLLQGVLSSNLLGFHTHDYSRHFQSAATRIVGAQCSNEQVKLHGAVSQLGTFPIGIDPLKFVNALKKDSVNAYLAELKSQFAGRRVLLGIDRLDYIKGITHKLHSLELFLDRHPEWVGKVVLVQIAIPSRTDVVEYQRLRAATHELVGRINGKYGSLASLPIHYLDQSIPFDKMCAMYRLADAMVITSIRDGMNLVAYEYIACQDGHNGVLILSEFAGAAQSLGAGALQVNPWNMSEVADAIHKALTMKETEKRTMTEYCFNHVMVHTAKAWAREFVNELEQLDMDDANLHSAISSNSLVSLSSTQALPVLLDTNDLCEKFTNSKHRLIITGLAGIVNRHRSNNSKNVPAESDADSDFETVYESGDSSVIWDWQMEAQHTTTKPKDKSSKESKSTLYGPSRYTNYNRRPSDYGDIPSHAADRSIGSMDEFMEMGADHDDDMPTNPQPTLEELRAAIVALASDPNTTFLVLTSRTREWCDALFAPISTLPPNLWFAAENGYFFKHGSNRANPINPSDLVQGSPSSNTPHLASPDWYVMYENVDFSWMEGVNRVMTYFCERTPRSYIQVQETSMQWHYGDADPVFAKRQALDLISHLTGGPLSNTSTEVLDSANIVQVRPLAVSKGRALKHLLTYLTRKYKRANNPLRLTGTGSSLGQPVSDSDDEDLGAGRESIDHDDSQIITGGSVAEPTPGLRSRRPSIDNSEFSSQETTSYISSSRAAALLPPQLSSPLQSAASIQPTNVLPIDFVLCIGNFLERDEDIFPLLNDWNDLGHLPPGLQSNVQPNSTSGSTPGFHHRRLSVSKANESNLSVNTNSLRVGTQPSPSPVSTSITEIASPGSSDFGGSSFGGSSLSIYTVTVGEKTTKARYYLPDLAAVNSLIVKLSHLPHQLMAQLTLTPQQSGESVPSKNSPRRYMLTDDKVEHSVSSPLLPHKESSRALGAINEQTIHQSINLTNNQLV